MVEAIGLKRTAAILWVLSAVLWTCRTQPSLPQWQLKVAQPDIAQRPAAVQNAVKAAFQSLHEIGEGAAPERLGKGYGQLGMTLLANGYPDLARTSFQEAIALDPANFQWPYLLGYVASEAEDWPQAVEWYEKSLSLEPRYAATHVRLGRIYLQLGQLDQAESQFRWVLAVNPQSAAAHFGLGNLAAERKDFPAAVTYYEKALTQVPHATSVYYPLAMAHRQLGNREQAQAALALRGKEDTPFFDPIIVEVEALDATPEEAARRGLAALEAHRLDRAETLLRKAVDLDPENGVMYLNYGFLKLRKQELEQAKTYFQKAVALDPALVEAHTNLGVVHALGGQEAPAIASFEKALSLDPQFQGARVLLANALMRLGEWQKALDQHRLVAAANPTDSRAAFYEVLMLVKLGKEQEAWQQLQGAVARFPTQAELVEAQARILACTESPAIKDGPRALELAKALFQERPSLSHAQTLAMALAANGEFQQAANLEAQGLAQLDSTVPPAVHLAVEARLARYRDGKPCREAWPDQDPLLRPGPP